MCACEAATLPRAPPSPPPAEAKRASGARLHNPLGRSADDARVARRPSRDDDRRANTYRQLFFFKKKKHAASVLFAVSELLIRRSIPIGLAKTIFFKFSTLIFYEVYFIKETQK